MPINLSALSQASNTALTLGNLILVTPQQTVGYRPQNEPSWSPNKTQPPRALVFNYEGEQSVRITSDVTDHYVENNSAVQDQIALKPLMITTQGFVGELNDIAPSALIPFKEAAEKLTIISGYAPSLSVTAQLAYAKAFQAYQVAASLKRSATETWSTINGNGDNTVGGQTVINGSTKGNSAGLITGAANNQNQQQIYFQQFYSYWKNRTLFTVQTPWAVFQDMVIMDMNAIQNADTRMISEFSITFKIMQFASTKVLTLSDLYDANNMEGRAQQQGSSEVDLGTASLQDSGITLGSVLA